MRKIVIVGGSLAGLRAAEELRRVGFENDIVLVGEERVPPYDRPPLSKQFLTGAWSTERLALRDASGLQELGLQMKLGRRAEALDVKNHRVLLSSGEEVEFDGLVIATGAKPKNLACAENITGVFTLRNVEDSLALSAVLDVPGTRLIIIGAGFIGSEIAAAAVSRDAKVTILEALPSPLARNLGGVIGDVCSALHASNGVDLRCNAAVREIVQDGDIKRVVLESGEVLVADAVVVGIGVQPAVSWLEASGLTIQDGVVCDSKCFAAPNIVAAGDVARWHHEKLGMSLRLEHWTNASEQGAAAARNLLAGPTAAEAYCPIPYVWSDQYDRRIQIAGSPMATDDLTIVSGSIEEGKILALAGSERLTSVISVGKGRDFIKYRQLLSQGASMSEALWH